MYVHSQFTCVMRDWGAEIVMHIHIRCPGLGVLGRRDWSGCRFFLLHISQTYNVYNPWSTEQENERRPGLMIDPHAPETRAPILASTNTVIKVRPDSVSTTHDSNQSQKRVRFQGDKLTSSEFTTFPLPPAYSPRVRSALNASSSSVRLSNLVGGNGWWYRWGRRIADVYVTSFPFFSPSFQ